jgi:xylan 1,4-beta-xylosidase
MNMVFGFLTLFSLITEVFGRQVSISVDVSQSLGEWTSINRFFGCDEPNYAYYPKGSALMKEIGALGNVQTYFRTHNLLTTGNGSTVGVPGLKFGSTNVYTKDAAGNPVYNFTIIDEIFDSYMAANVKPYLELSFSPKAMAEHPDPYFFYFNPADGPDTIYTGWTHPPKSYEAWGELVYKLTKHLVARYGEDEVDTWYFEVWNEPQGPCEFHHPPPKVCTAG